MEDKVNEMNSVKNLIQDFQSQDLFSQKSTTSTPLPKRPKKKAKSQNKNGPTGVLPVLGSNKEAKEQHVFIQEEGAGSSREATSPDPSEEEFQSGQEDTSGSPPTAQETDKSLEAKRKIQEFVEQFVSNSKQPSSEIDRALRDLQTGYLQIMRSRDHAQRNLENIRYARNRHGRVPRGMQIKITPECPGNELPTFQQTWAYALSEAENLLADCMVDHLVDFIKKLDQKIYDLVNNTVDILTDRNEEDPMDKISNTLSTANDERAKNNERILKRKRENNVPSDSGKQMPPAKKFKKNEKSKE